VLSVTVARELPGQKKSGIPLREAYAAIETQE